jgi:ketosteroid isomerase-like protein
VTNRERIEAVYREWATGNLRAGQELFAAEISFEPAADGRATFGRDEIAGYMREFLEQWDVFRVEAEEIEERGEEIVVTEHQRGTGRTSGIEIDQTDYAIWTFRGAEVIRVRWTLERPN